MIVMPGDNTGVIVGYLAGRYPGKIGHLFSPSRHNGPFSFIPYALDNGAFAGGQNWNEALWHKHLEWAKLSGQRPLWVLAPDMVADRVETLRKWDIYAPQLHRYGWPLAFAVQDGMTEADVPGNADVVFVGGSTEWKWRTAEQWCKSFQRVHVGRVNSYRHLWRCDDYGAESCDGTGWMRGDQVQYRGLLAYGRTEACFAIDFAAVDSAGRGTCGDCQTLSRNKMGYGLPKNRHAMAGRI